MAQATIGSLNVVLGMDAGDFNRAAADANASLKRLADNFDRFRNATVVAASLAAVGWAAGKVTSGIGSAVDKIGDLVDMSQRLGAPVEQLQGLAHAAELSGTSIEAVGKGLAKFSQNLAEIAGGDTGGKAAQTLAALGISATDAAGNVKNADVAMVELANKFEGMQDGAAKTAAAMALIGKSGAEMIPLLNLGGAELARIRNEANELGFVLDGKVANGLEALGDQWATLAKAAQGFWTQLSGQLLPVFQLFTDKIQEWLRTGGGVKGWAQTVGDGLKEVVQWALELTARLQRLGEGLSTFWENTKRLFSGAAGDIAAANEESAKRILAINEQLKSDLAAVWANPSEVGASMTGTPDAPKPNAPVVDHNAMAEAKKVDAIAQQQLNAQLAERNRLEAEGKQLRESLRDPMEELAAQELKLAELRRVGAISAVEGAKLMQKAVWNTASAYAGMASQIAGNLSGLFGESKAFAIASAIINTAESITKTLATYGATPWGLAAAASAAAAGAAQIASIRSASKGGGGGSASVSGGGGSVVEGQQAAGATQAQGVYLNLQGQGFRREEIIGLIGQINEASKDGYRIVLSQGQS
jgi:hypothetical protein